MKSPSRKYLLAMGALLLLGAVVWSVLRPSPVPPRMAVGVLGVEKDPLGHLPQLAGVLNGATGLSAFFAVTNVGKDAGIWFDTCALEQKVGGQWQRVPVAPYTGQLRARAPAGRKPWLAIASDDMLYHVLCPGGACAFVVEWPPGVPTNATWRLQLRYGRPPSKFTKTMGDMFDITGKFGSFLFNQRRADGILVTPEVKQ